VEVVSGFPCLGSVVSGAPRGVLACDLVAVGPTYRAKNGCIPGAGRAKRSCARFRGGGGSAAGRVGLRCGASPIGRVCRHASRPPGCPPLRRLEALAGGRCACAGWAWVRPLGGARACVFLPAMTFGVERSTGPPTCAAGSALPGTLRVRRRGSNRGQCTGSLGSLTAAPSGGAMAASPKVSGSPASRTSMVPVNASQLASESRLCTRGWIMESMRYQSGLLLVLRRTHRTCPMRLPDASTSS